LGIDHLEYNIGTRVLKDVKIYSGVAQSGSNPCSENNGGCRELCAFDGAKAVCLCSHGKLASDGLSCAPYDAFLIFSRVSRIETAHMFDDKESIARNSISAETCSDILKIKATTPCPCGSQSHDP
jgi:hypothetical protein